MAYNWPLSNSNFTWLDRLKICKFFLDPKRQWTEGEEVRKFQKQWAQYVGCQYAVMTSSGSTANTLIAQYLRDKNQDNRRNTIVTQPVGWMTSYSPFIREGFHLDFIDVTLDNLSMDLNKLDKYLKINHNKVAAVFIVSILGFAPDIKKLKEIESKYNVKICLDNCESSNSSVDYSSISSHFTSSTSFYFSHIHTVGTESGMIFTNSKEEFQYFQLAKHNGLVRVLEPYVHMNKEDQDLEINELTFEDVQPKFNKELKDGRFDFYQLGNNYRSSDVNAFIGSLDFARNEFYNQRRLELYYKFANYIDLKRYKAVFAKPQDVPFAIPIIIHGSTKKEKEDRFKDALTICDALRIEYRLIVSGNILRQTAFKNYGNPKDFKVAEEIHNYGFYIGLHPKLKEDQIIDLVIELNRM